MLRERQQESKIGSELKYVSNDRAAGADSNENLTPVMKR
jgi:hypothetical protein